MSRAVGLLERGIDELTTLDPDDLTDDELHEHVIALQRLADRLTAATAPLLERWDARTVWAGDGSKSAAARLARETGAAKRTCNAALRRARSLRSMPATGEAARQGALPIDQVDLLCKVNTPSRRELFREREDAVLHSIRGLRYHQAVQAVAYWGTRADAHLGIEDRTADDQAAANRLHASETLDGMVAIDGLLDAISGAIVTGELGRLIAELRKADVIAGIERTLPQLRAAALVEMARRSATMPKDGRAPKPLFTAHVGEGTVAHLCELANGTVITPRQLAPFMTDAMLEVVLFDGPTTVISVSKKRTFTGALRRAIEARDRHCQHPSGCDEPADRCDVDHIIPWANDGPTSQSNGRLQCAVHNRNPEKHDHGAQPFPERTVSRSDELAARVRWRMRRSLGDQYRPEHAWPVTLYHYDPDAPGKLRRAS